MKLKKDNETLSVIIKKQGSVVENNFCAISICNFRESLTRRILTESKGK